MGQFDNHILRICYKSNTLMSTKGILCFPLVETFNLSMEPYSNIINALIWLGKSGSLIVKLICMDCMGEDMV